MLRPIPMTAMYASDSSVAVEICRKMIPPLATEPDAAPTPINQMDLWQSGELFCWMLPQALKLELLRMRQSFRRANP